MVDSDLAAAVYVAKYAMASVVRGEGREPWPWSPGENHAQRHILSTDPAGSFVATINGLVVGFTQGFVRGDIWFLAQLFVHPEVHARGIGRTLLKLALDYGREAGCGIFSVVSSTSQSRSPCTCGPACSPSASATGSPARSRRCSTCPRRMARRSWS
jgi:GNAT superfamily N-acetyltransferase